MNLNDLLFLNIEKSTLNDKTIILGFSIVDISNNIVMEHSFDTDNEWQINTKLDTPWKNFDNVWKKTLDVLEKNPVVAFNIDCFFCLERLFLTVHRANVHYREYRHYFEAKFRHFDKICLLEKIYQNDALQVNLRKETAQATELFKKIINSSSPDSELFFLYEHLINQLDEMGILL